MLLTFTWEKEYFIAKKIAFKYYIKEDALNIIETILRFKETHIKLLIKFCLRYFYLLLIDKIIGSHNKNRLSVKSLFLNIYT